MSKAFFSRREEISRAKIAAFIYAGGFHGRYAGINVRRGGYEEKETNLNYSFEITIHPGLSLPMPQGMICNTSLGC